jgi:filamentous hemagglutinin family protein
MIRTPISRPRTARIYALQSLLASASALALLVHAGPAEARCIGFCGAGTSAAASAANAAVVSAQQAAQATAQSMNSLTRATLAVQAMAAAQAAAHNLALSAPSSVPNGLTPGGLVPDSGLAAPGVANPVTSWNGLNTPSQTTNGGQTVVTITQSAPKAIANWSSFNIGANTLVHFDQTLGNTPGAPNSWVVLNRVVDPSGVPSQIMGQIRAEGSVYIINGNGIIFGGGSQVNVNSFLASSLNLFSNIYSDPNPTNTNTTVYRFLNGGIGDLSSANFTSNSILLTSPSKGPVPGNITIQAGASITVGTSQRAIIAAPNVTNNGVIVAPSGQVALIAGIGVSYDYNISTVGTAVEVTGTNDQSSTMLVFSNSGQMTDGNGHDITPVGTLVNNGLILTPRGNITLLGGAVAQNGVAVATTDVKQPGSILVNSTYEAGGKAYTGAVSFGPQAVTSILPDGDGVPLQSDASSLAPFQVNPSVVPNGRVLPVQGFGLISINGQAIDFQGGTEVYAPGQGIVVATTVTVDPRTSVPSVPGSGRILLESGAVIDASGIPDVELPATYNLMTVTLSGNELADSPLQQIGALFGAKITVDLSLSGTNPLTGESWVGTPLANLTGYLNSVQRSIGQVLLNGGAISFTSNEFIGAPGSVINLMGGYEHFLGGMVSTTEVIGSDGRIYNIGSANPNVTMVGIAGQFIVDHPHWQQTDVYINRLIGGSYYQNDYIQGGNGGSLAIQVNSANGAVANSGAAILQSTALAGALAGLKQVESGNLPAGGTFSFTSLLPIEIGDPATLSAPSLAASSPPANFSMASPLLATPGSVYASANVFNDQVLDNAGFANLSFFGAAITEDAGATLAVQPGGSISFGTTSTPIVGSATINGDLSALAGNVGVATQSGGIVIGSSAVLDVNGLFFNESPAAGQRPGIAGLINGGSISLVTGASGNITLASGSVLDLEGGGLVQPNGQLKTGSTGAPAGSGGNLTLVTYGNGTTPINGGPPPGGILTVSGTIDALGFSGGGTLTLQTIAFQIGGNAATTPTYAYYFDPTFWGDLGFASFNLSSLMQSEVPAGAMVRLTHENLLPNAVAIGGAPNGANPAAFSKLGVLTGTLLSPTNLSVTAGLEQKANFTDTSGGADYAQVDPGAQILADPGASVSLTSYAMITVFGGIYAPGGSISLTENYSVFANSGGPIGPIYLGPQSVLDVAGTAVVNPLAAPVPTRGGLLTPYTGNILPGGTVTITNNYSPILVAPGAVINVSGAAGAFDVAELVPGGPLGSLHEVLTRQPVWSNAGQVNINGVTGLVFEGTLIGNGGSPLATGATLQLTGDNNVITSTTGSVILVQDTAQALAASGSSFNFSTFVPAVGPDSGAFTTIPNVSNAIVFGADTLNGSGFASLIVNGGFIGTGFSGQVSLTLANSFITNTGGFFATSPGNLSTATASITNGASLSVSAPYIAVNGLPIGSNGLPQTNSTPGTGDATLTLSANEIDLSGFLVLQSIGQANFISTGDIRLLPAATAPAAGNYLLGYLLTSGNLSFAAADVYPATDTAFVIEATPQNVVNGPQTSVTFQYPSGGQPSATTPLSAGGALLVDATTITQNGEIQAPFGQIILGVSATGSALFNVIGNDLGLSTLAGLFTEAINTQIVTLGSGSITSVSANGMIIPFGSTVDQTTWIYNPQLNNPTWDGGSQQVAFAAPLTAAPQGIVTLTANSVSANTGAVVNLNGGGDLQAQEWIPGTGGSRNVLLQYQTSYQNATSGQQVPTYSDQRQIFAIVPGYAGALAPYDANLSQAGLAAGEAIYLAGGNGLAAGYYTLLPAQYATLPGAYRVVANSGVTNPVFSRTVTLPDGTMEMTGYLTNTITGSRPSSTQQFYVQSGATWSKYSQYALTSANSFFPSYAAANGLATPIIPADAGRLAISAVNSLTLNATIEGAPGPGGFGGQLDISGQNLLIVDDGSGTVQLNPGTLNFSAPNASTTDTLLSGTTVTFNNAASDTFTLTGTWSLVVPAGGRASQFVSSSSGRVILNDQSIVLPAGDTVTSNGVVNVAVHTSGADIIDIGNGAKFALPTSSATVLTLPNTTATVAYSFSSGSGGNAITITSASEFTVGGVNAPRNPATGLFTVTGYSAGQPIQATVAGQGITLVIGSSGSGNSLVGAGGTLSFTNTAGGTGTAALGTSLAGGTAIYQLIGPSFVAFSQADQLTGPISVSGSTPVTVFYSPGAYSVSAGQYGGLSPQTAFTATAADTIAYSAGAGPVSVTTGQQYLELSARQLDGLDIGSLLLGGIRQFTSAGMAITPTANSVVIANDAAAPLTAPEILLTATPQFQNSAPIQLDREGDTVTVQVPVAGSGQVVFEPGSVVAATGTVGPGEPRTIILGNTQVNLPNLPASSLASTMKGLTEIDAIQAYYADLDAQLGTLVRLSNGNPATIQVPSAALLNPGTISVADDVNPANAVLTVTLPSLSGITGAVVQSNATVAGGNALTFASTGGTTFQAGALISGSNISADSGQITFVGSGTPPANGSVINPATVVALRNAETVNLQSAGTIAFEGNVTLAVTGGDGQGSLTLGGGALSSDGGTVSINTPMLVLDNELGAAVPAFAAGTGRLIINVGELVFGTGDKTLQGFGTLGTPATPGIVATQGVLATGTGSMNFGSLPLTLRTPIVIADAGSSQVISTTNADINLVPAAADTPMTSAALGGAITFETQQSGAITVAIPIQALAGNISLLTGSNTGVTTGGNVTVTGTGQLLAQGVAVPFYGLTEYAQGGAITLSANAGTVSIQPGAVVNFSGATDSNGNPLGGNGGSLSITTTNSTAPVTIAPGTLLGTTAPGYSGSSFSLNSAAAVALDNLATILNGAGVSGGISVQSGQGDLTLTQTLTAQTVQLVANAGTVNVAGTINASGAAGGTIELFGASGVTLTGSLIATGSDPNQLGGTVEIGTSGTPNSATTADPAGAYNATYGYENVAAGNSGTITIGANAVINVSGGTFDGETGGTVLFRAPLLENGGVNVTLPSTFASNAGVIGSRRTTLEAYAAWSTADSTTGAQHFDGIIDPAGWYDSSGTLLSGSFVNGSNTVVATWNGSALTNQDGTTNPLSYYLNTDYFTPTAANTDPSRTAHETFYGYVNGDSTAAARGTLMGFVQAPVAAGQGFQSIANSGGIANFQETPGIELDNPKNGPANPNNPSDPSTGTISVLTNWNLGAENAAGNLVFRYNGVAPVLTVRARGNLAIKASITDGFIQPGSTLFSPPPVPNTVDTYTNAFSTYTADLATEGSAAFAALTFPNAAVLAANNDTASGLAIQAPTELSTGANAYDQYYEQWDSYNSTYSSFFSRLENATNRTHYSITGLTPSTTLTSTKATAAAKTDANNLISAISALQGAANFTDYTGYATYIADYQTYGSDYIVWANAVRTLGILTLIQPPLPPPAISIPYVATNPAPLSFAQANSPNVMVTLGNQAAIAGMALSNEASTTSYRLVAGANLGGADPLSLELGNGGSVTLDQHTTLQISTVNSDVIVMPTIVRTGTGSIDIAAAGNFQLLDPLAPGVVYTAGKAMNAPTPSQAATLALGGGAFTGQTGISSILTPAVDAEGAGNLSLTVGGNIFGIENVTDTLATTATSPTGLTSNPGGFVGQLWVPWLLDNPSTPNVPWYVNFGSFDQGLMSVGGNVTVTAGGSIHDLAVSLPTTAFLDTSNTLHVYGGGNLAVTAGGSIYSGDFYIGKGTGTINAGGAITSDFNYTPISDPTHVYSVATLLAVQYGAIAVNAREAVNIGGVYDPTYLFSPSMNVISTPVEASGINLVPYVTSMNASSGVSVQSTAGTLTFNSSVVEGDMIGLGGSSPGAFISSLLLPASLDLVALGGSIDIDHGGGLYPSATGTLSILADQSVYLAVSLVSTTAYTTTNSPTGSSPVNFTAVGNVFGTTLGKLDYPMNTGILPTASAPALVPVASLSPARANDPSLILNRPSDLVQIYALNGSIVDGLPVTKSEGTISSTNGIITPALGSTIDQISLIPNAPAQLYAGQDIVDLPFYGTNFTATDITSIIARGNIRYNIFGDQQSPNIELAGPGALNVIAGGNISFESKRVAGVTESGIRTIGNSIDAAAVPVADIKAYTTGGSNVFVTSIAGFGNPYLPKGGASVNVLFGVGRGINYAGFIADYVNPATGAAVIADEPLLLTQLVDGYEQSLGETGLTRLTSGQAWAIFQTLPAQWQDILAQKIFFDVLNAVGKDETNINSTYYHQYARGYQAINTLFPAAFGYTVNALGTVNGANKLVQTGSLDMRGSTVQTQQGGDISIIGPGGEILVGSSVAAPAVNPATEGIITLESGNISIFTDRDVQVAQSRIMTEQGGSILMWSSNGNLDAGKGAKTSVSAPPPKYDCDIDFICTADIKGAVSGAGIATLQSLPGVPVGDANLIAPRGTVNAGAAGLRVSGNLNIAALQVLNAYNIQVQGTITGLPTYTGPSMGSLTSANNQAGAAQVAVPPPSNGDKDKPSIVIVEFIGFGGDNPDDDQHPDNRQKPDGRQGHYDIRSRFQVVGVGDVTEAEANQLADERRVETGR